ncbi:MAG TPA: hypothetical protein GXX17_06915 [Clostridiales bacterium]|nr:hypothetical protein [Clostridiales bacterium]
MSGRKDRRGCFAVAFAAGLLIAYFCPPKIIIGILAVVVIILGIVCIKS